MITEYGKRLRAARMAARLTQQGLAKKTGITQSTISTAERFGNGSSNTTIYAQACDVDPHWLATGEGQMKQPKEMGPPENTETDINYAPETIQSLFRLAAKVTNLTPRQRRHLASLYQELITQPDQVLEIAPEIAGLLAQVPEPKPDKNLQQSSSSSRPAGGRGG